MGSIGSSIGVRTPTGWGRLRASVVAAVLIAGVAGFGLGRSLVEGPSTSAPAVYQTRTHGLHGPGHVPRVWVSHPGGTEGGR
jgi:hypothetical protein